MLGTRCQVMEPDEADVEDVLLRWRWVKVEILRRPSDDSG